MNAAGHLRKDQRLTLKVVAAEATAVGWILTTTKRLFTLAVAFALSSSALAGVRVYFAESVRPKSAKQQPGAMMRRIDIDGSRFRITSPNPNPTVETSLDDGATTFFGTDRANIQTPLARHKSGHLGGVSISVEDEGVTVGAPHPGPTIGGVATQTYTVEYRGVLVTRIKGVAKSRDSSTEHYEISVGDIGASPAAVRVLLSRGLGMSLAQHAEAFRGFPLRIDGHLVEGNGPTTGPATDFRLEAVSIEAWSWPGEQ